MSLAPMDPVADAAGAASRLSRPQKAAAVLLALGTDRAEAVLRELFDDEVEQIAREVVELGFVPPEQLAGVLSEFHQEAVAHRTIVTGGEQHARAMLRAWRGDRGDEIVDRLIATARQTPFNFLTGRTPDAVARLLRNEHPQVGAVVLSHMPSRFSALVLAALPEDLRADVAVRVATMQPPPAAMVSRIEAALRASMGDAQPVPSAQSSGLRELANMLNSVDADLGSAILDTIEQVDEPLANEIRGQMFIFDDLAALTDRDLQEVLREIDAQQLALAMKGLEGQLHDTILRNLSERAREALTEEIELLGPAPRSEIDGARSEIAGQVRRMVEEGTVTLMRGDAGDVVA